MCQRVSTCVLAHLYVIKDVDLVFLLWGDSCVYTLLCVCALVWEYRGGCGYGPCGLTPPGAVQMQPLSLEDSMVQYKEPWTEFEAGG